MGSRRWCGRKGEGLLQEKGKGVNGTKSGDSGSWGLRRAGNTGPPATGSDEAA